MNVVRKSVIVEDMIRKYGDTESRILNIGSGTANRYGPECINFDALQKDHVDIVGDAHSLPFVNDEFDICVMCAMLQYCLRPDVAIQEATRVLRPGGLLIIDAPFVQPYCPDTPDLFRFTARGLESLLGDNLRVFDLLVSVAGGSALAFYCQALASWSIRNRMLRGLSVIAISLLVWPIKFLELGRARETAGAHFLAARKYD